MEPTVLLSTLKMGDKFRLVGSDVVAEVAYQSPNMWPVNVIHIKDDVPVIEES